MASTRIRYWLFCVALLIGLCCVAPAAMAAPAANLRVAKVTALSGEVQVKKAGGEKNFKAFKNMGLTEGDTIITGEASSLTLELDDFEEVRIGEKSHVLISELRVALDESSEQTTFNLLAGGLWSNIRKQLNLDSRYQIKTANAVMGVRGTMWYVGQRDGRTDVAVLEGTVLTTPNLPPQSQPGLEPPAYSLTAGQQVSLDMPPAQSEDFVVQPLMPESFDLLLLQMIDELSGTRPDVVPPSMALQVQQLISQFQPPPAPPAPPAPRMILDPLVVPPQYSGDQDAPPQLPAISLQPIGNQVVAANGTIFVSPIVSLLDASISATASNADGLEIVTDNSGSTPLLQITGKQVGTYTVTVTASRSGYISDSKTFTVRVVNAPTITGLEIAGDHYVGEEIWVTYQYSDADEEAESGTTYQWQRAAVADAPDSGWSPISGATLDGYFPTTDDQGKWLRCVVTPKDGIVFGTPVTSNVIGAFGDRRDVYGFPNIGDVTVAKNGVIRIPLPAAPTFLQNAYNYSGSGNGGYSADPSIAVVGLATMNSPYFLSIAGQAVGETDVCIIVRDPDSTHQTTRVRFHVTVIDHGEQLPWVDPATFKITGTTSPGHTLTASYLFDDPSGHEEGDGWFTWYRHSNQNDPGEEIYGQNGKTYSLTENDVGCYFSVGLNPCDEFGFGGEAVESGLVGPVNTVPTANSVSVTGFVRTGETLQLSYVYSDGDGHAEGDTEVQWYRGAQADGSGREPIPDANTPTYCPTVTDEAQYIWVAVTPRDTLGGAGSTVFSSVCGPVVQEGYIWAELGPLPEAAAALSYDSRLTLRRDGVGGLFCAYLDGASAAHVFHWDGYNWSELPTASPAYAYSLQFDVDGGIPYVAYNLRYDGVYVKRYVGGQWETVAGVPVMSGDYDLPFYGLSLDVEAGTAYVALGKPVYVQADQGWRRRPTVFQSSEHGWVQLGPVGLIASPPTVSGLGIAVRDGVPYVGYRELFAYDPVSVLRYSSGVWSAFASYDSGSSSNQAEVFELQFGADGLLYLVSSLSDASGSDGVDGSLGPAITVAEVGQPTPSFGPVGSVGFGEEGAEHPTAVVTVSEKFAAYQNAQGIAVFRLNGGQWTHFGGVDITGGQTPSLAVDGNMLLVAYVDAQRHVRVARAATPTATIAPMPTMDAPVWSEVSPALLEWTPAADAQAYRLRVWKGESVIKIVALGRTATSYDLGEILRANGDGSYTVQIRAIGDGQVYADGTYSSPSQALVGPIALAGVGTPVWSEDSTISWEPVDAATGYRLTLSRRETLDHSETVYEVDVDSHIHSYDFSQVIDIADKRTWDGSLQAVSYYAMVTSLGSGIYANGPTSPASSGPERMAVPPVSGITLLDERDAGNASDFDLNLTLPSDQTNVAEYRVILHASNYYQLNLGDLSEVPSSRYQSISTSTDSPVQLREDLLDWEGRSITVGESYRAYVITVPKDGATRYAYSKSAEPMSLAVPDFRIVGCTAETGSTHVYVDLLFSASLRENLVLSGDDFLVRPIVDGTPGAALSGVTAYPSYNTISLTIPAAQSVSEYEITVRSRDAIGSQDSEELSGSLCWPARIWNSATLSIESVALSNSLNQVVLQFAATPNDDRFFLALPGEVSVRLLQSVNLRSDLGVSLALSAYYTSDGRLVINLPHAETGVYGEIALGFLSKLYPQVSLEGDLVLRDNGDAWGYSWRPFQPGV